MIMDERDTRMRTFLTIGLIGLTGAFGYSMGVDRTGRIQDERLGKTRVYAPAISRAQDPDCYGVRGAGGATCNGGNFASLASLSHDSSP
jgi:hypothetical protein